MRLALRGAGEQTVAGPVIAGASSQMERAGRRKRLGGSGYKEPPGLPPRMAGYTLMELLVILALIGLLASVTLPRLHSGYQSAQRAFEREDVAAQLAALGYRAARERREISLEDAPAQGLLQLPEGWRLTPEAPVIYRANGTCAGGTVSVRIEERYQTWKLEPPWCQPRG
jgi:type II secretory pathway pseudopilin PulG